MIFRQAKDLDPVVGRGGISAKVVLFSDNDGAELTTMELVYPRFIHSEFMTHRMFSRNASSSRAIPIEKVLDQVVSNPACPIEWGLNKAGMQAKEQQADISEALSWWLQARDLAVESVRKGIALGLHKQIVNRILEPWQFMHTLVSATEWDNFFEQRISPFAQPEMQELAKCMKSAIEEAREAAVDADPFEDEYKMHLPYLQESDSSLSLSDMSKVSVARCCRVSYLKHGGGVATLEEDLHRHDELLRLGHWSPFEHVALGLGDRNTRSANFYGWQQYRVAAQILKRGSIS